MQALLTIGERSITTALHGRNTSAAKRLLTDLMQSDLVVPLLVAGSSVRRSAHVQEGLLRLQLQKLRYQLVVHDLRKSGDEVGSGGAAALDALLPEDLLDDVVSESAAKPLAVTSTGLQPIALPTAIRQLWQSLQPCLQPDAPLIKALGEPAHAPHTGASAGAALANCMQQLARWSSQCLEEPTPQWLPALQYVLSGSALQAQLHAQLRPSQEVGAQGDHEVAPAAGVANVPMLLADPVTRSAPVLCALAAAAVCTGPPLRTAWLSLGDWLYRSVRRARQVRRISATEIRTPVGGIKVPLSKTPLSASDELCYKHIVLAYARALSLDFHTTSGTDTTRLLLRLLHFAIHHNTAVIQPAIAEALNMVPPAAWEVLAPQLFVQLQHSQAHVRAYATQLLAALAKPVPASVLYAVVASSTAAAATAPETLTLLSAVAAGSTDRVAHCRSLLAGLRQLTPLAAESWQTTLHAALVEIRRRGIMMKAELTRMHATAGAASDGPAMALWHRRYGALVAHGAHRLRLLLEVRSGCLPTLLCLPVRRVAKSTAFSCF
jgi:hypothetical protein